jgi:recombination protein RecA
MAVEAIQRRWGSKALRKTPTSPKHSASAIPTGFPELDEALGIGGIPRGRITEMLGSPTSGMTTLALKTVAAGQAQGDIAIYVDLGHTFDPDYAARCGVTLENLLLVRPTVGLEALQIVLELVTSGGVGILVVDGLIPLLVQSALSVQGDTFLRQLNSALHDSPCALLFLTALRVGDTNRTPNQALAHYATLRLWVEKQRWLKAHQDIQGYESQIMVLKNRLATPGRRAKIAIRFDTVVRGNGT